MARISLGLGTSHSPQLNTPPETWPRHGEGDKRNPWLFDGSGKQVTWEELLSRAGNRYEGELSTDKHAARFERCNQAIAALQQTLRERRPGAVIVFGDDQAELFPEDWRPAFQIHWGEDVLNMPKLYTESPNELWRQASWAYGPPGGTCAVPSAFAKHIVEQLVADGFDVAQSRRLAPGMGVGHAFGFIVGRIMDGHSIPLIPVVMNTMYPPNQPTPKRCFELGQAVASAIESWDEDMEVCVVGSGGLSHFVIDEELDAVIMRALGENDAATLCSLPGEKLQSGSSEIRSWVAAAGALQHLRMELVDYVPCYRSAAGTGVAMTFARWS